MRNMMRRLLVLLAVLVLAVPLTAFADAAKDYEKAQALLVKNKYAEAAEAFRKLGSYEDATVLAMYSEACALAEQGDYDTAILVMKSMGEYKDCHFRVIYYTARAHEAAAGTDTWEVMLEAQSVYRTIPLFLDSRTRCAALDGRIAAAKQSQYDAAVTAGESGDYATATKAFRRLGSYLDCPSRIVYYAIRKDEGALNGVTDQDAIIAVANRYADMGEYLDAQTRAATVTAQADAVVADRYAQVDALIAAGSYADADRTLSSFGVYGNGQIPAKYYEMGHHALLAESYAVAISAFAKAGSYENAADCGVYAAIRRDEANRIETTDQDVLIALTVRYAALGDAFDCNVRIAALTARADAIVADKYAHVDALTAEGKYSDAAMALSLFGAYGNGQIPAKHYAIGVHALENGKWANATSAFRAAGSYSDSQSRITYTAIRKDEESLTGSTDQDALMALQKRYAAMGEYLDCPVRAAAMQAQADVVVQGKYLLIDSLTAQGKYTEAERNLSTFGTYGNAQISAKRYAIGVHALEAGDYTKATAVFKALGSYSDAKDRVTYTAIRKDQAALTATPSSADSVIAIARRYTAMGDKYDCAARAAALTAVADRIVAARYAEIDRLITAGDYTTAERYLNNFWTYGNDQISAKRYAIGLHALENGNYSKATSVFKALGNYFDAKDRVTYTAIRRDEAALAGSTDQDAVLAVAKRYKEMGQKYDCVTRAATLTTKADQIVADKYAKIDSLTKQGRYSEAEKILSAFGTYGNGQLNAKRYAIGVHALENGNYTKATSVFKALGSYSDAKDRVTYTAIRKDEAYLTSASTADTVIAIARRYTAMGAKFDCAARATALTAKADKIVADKYATIDSLTAQGKYTDAERMLDNFGTYGNDQISAKRYAIGVHALENGKYDKATTVFKALGTYSDAAKRVTYTAIRKSEASLRSSDSADTVIVIAKRYTAMGAMFDCADRAAALTAKADQIVADKYAQVDALTAQGKYADATRVLGSFGTYGKAQIPAKYYAIGDHAMGKAAYDDAIAAFKAAGRYSDAADRATYATLRKSEVNLAGSTAQDSVIGLAQQYAALGDKYDCAARAAALTTRADAIVADRYATIDQLTAQGKYTDAEKILSSFGTYGNDQVNAKRYAIGVHALEKGDYTKATAVFKALGDYSDAKARVTYTAIRKDEAAFNSNTPADAIMKVAGRYAALGDKYDCAARVEALTARADADVADRYAQVDALTAQGKYTDAEYILTTFGSYGSDQVKAKRYAIGMHALENGSYSRATTIFRGLGSYSDAEQRVTYTAIRKDEADLGSTNSQDTVIAVAKRYTAMGDVFDCADRAAALTARADAIVADKYAKIDQMIAQGKYTNAESNMSGFGSYGSEQLDAKRYALGVHALEAGNYTKATSVFKVLGSYSDAKDRVTYTAIRKDEAALKSTSPADAIMGVARRYTALGDKFDCAARAAALTTRADAYVANQYAQVDSLTAKSNYTEAEKILSSFGTYGAEQVMAKRYAIGVHALEHGNYAKATSVFTALGSYADSKDRVTYTAIRKDEAALNGKTSADAVISVARRYAAMGDKFDCPTRAADLTTRADAYVANQYAQVDTLTAQGKYTEAEKILSSFGTYGADQVLAKRYAMGMHALDNGAYDAAISTFRKLGAYSDAAKRVDYATVRKNEAFLENSTDQDMMLTVSRQYAALGDLYDCPARSADMAARADATVAAKYEKVDGLIALRRVDEAYEILNNFGTYGAEKLPPVWYALGQKALNDGHKGIAIFAFRQAGSHSDAAKQAAALQPQLNASIAAAGTHTVALRKNGTVVAVGDNSSGQCTVGSWTNIVAVAAGSQHTVGLRKDGTVVAVGYGSYSNSPKAVDKWSNVTAIAAGNSHTVGLRKDGSVVAVGSNSDGQLNVGNWRSIVAIAAGDSFTVGLRVDGTVVACGDNEFGQCDVKTWRNVVAIAAGSNHTIGLCADGTVLEIGDNGYAQCDVKDWTGIVAIAAGGNYTLGLRADGTLVATGWNGDGLLSASRWTDIVAISAGKNHAVGLKVDGSIVTVGNNASGQGRNASWADVTATAAGMYHTVGLRKDGTVIATGSNDRGQCNVTSWKDVIAISAGEEFTLGLRKDGTVVATGYNYNKQINVGSWKNITAIAAGTAHSVGLKSDGTVVATGYNYYKQCDVSAWRNITAIAAGDRHTVGLRKDGTVVAVGNNSAGQCNVTGWRNIIAIACGDYHTLGLRADGTVVAVGDNGKGQRAVSNWNGVVAISAGSTHSVGLLSNGVVVVLGDTSNGKSSVGSWKDIVDIAAGYNITMGVRKDGTVVAVGENKYCQCNTFIWNLFD